jgi:hypothetical protein
MLNTILGYYTGEYRPDGTEILDETKTKVTYTQTPITPIPDYLTFKVCDGEVTLCLDGK